MLTLDLSKIRTAHERFEQTYRPEALAADGDAFCIVGPVSLQFDVQKDKEQFRLIGTLAAALELPCSRCLEPFSWPVDATLDVRYQPHVFNAGEGEREIEEDDLATAFYDDASIDLGHLMREQFYLSLPMKPLCTDACRGLCPVCGVNLNRESCGCNTLWEDPRLAALKALSVKGRDPH